MTTKRPKAADVSTRAIARAQESAKRVPPDIPPPMVIRRRQSKQVTFTIISTDEVPLSMAHDWWALPGIERDEFREALRRRANAWRGNYDPSQPLMRVKLEPMP